MTRAARLLKKKKNDIIICAATVNIRSSSVRRGLASLCYLSIIVEIGVEAYAVMACCFKVDKHGRLWIILREIKRQTRSIHWRRACLMGLLWGPSGIKSKIVLIKRRNEFIIQHCWDLFIKSPWTLPSLHPIFLYHSVRRHLNWRKAEVTFAKDGHFLS